MKLPDRYTKTSDLGGGMSNVWLCHDKRLDRDVVIKWLDDDVDEGRLLDEISALQSIRSGYVVQVYDVLADDDGAIAAVVEEYCPGSDLIDKRGTITGDEFIKIGYQFSSGILEIHEAGVIHRDIKPNNVRMSSVGDLTIIDFGLARFAADNAKTGSVIGTKGFMAPELFIPNEKGEITFGSGADIFAFGSSMYLMAEGSLPLNLKKQPPQMMSHGADFNKSKLAIDGALAASLNTCFEVSPDDRPSAVDLREAFRRVILFNRHRALVNLNGTASYLDVTNPSVTATVPGLASVVIEYDGHSFRATTISGDLYVNNTKVVAGHIFPDSCVIAFGGPQMGSARVYVTFDVSHPGVEL